MPISVSMRGRPCGRKRQLVVDTQGRLWVAAVHPANQADGPAAVSLIGDLLWRAGERLEKVYGDQSYNGVFAKALADWSIDFEKASRPESAQGFVPVAKRWVVERTIAWSNYFRRIVKDYEYTLLSSVNWLYLANIQLIFMLVRARVWVSGQSHFGNTSNNAFLAK